MSKHQKLLKRAIIGIVLAVIVVYLLIPLILVEVTRSLLAERKHDSALRMMQAAVMLQPRSAEAHFLLARANRRLRRNLAFKSSLAKAKSCGIDEQRAKREELLLGIINGIYPDDILTWRKLLNEAGADLPEICEGFVYFRMQRFETNAALDILDAWQKEYPKSHRVFQIRGKILYALERKKEAAEQFEQSLALNPSNPEIRIDLAQVLIDRLVFDRAVEVLGKCLEIAPGNVEAKRLLAEAYAHQGRTFEANGLILEALSEAPDDPALLYERGRLELALGESASGLDALQKAAELRPTDRKIRYELGRAFQRLGMSEQAKEQFDFVETATAAVMRLPKLTAKLADDPQNIQLRFEIAEISWTYESRETGARWLHDLLEFEPNHLPALRLLEKHYRLQGNRKQAERMAERVRGSGSTTSVSNTHLLWVACLTNHYFCTLQAV